MSDKQILDFCEARANELKYEMKNINPRHEGATTLCVKVVQIKGQPHTRRIEIVTSADQQSLPSILTLNEGEKFVKTK